MESPEYIVHGTSSEKDALGIEAEGYMYKEGRASVSGDLLYAFRWATDTGKRRGSQSTSEVRDGEIGRIIVMAVPEDKAVDYSRHTEIEVDDVKREVTGFLKKWQSGRKQLAIYPSSGDVVQSRKGRIDKEDILMSFVPTPELGQKLDEMREEINNLHKIDLEK